ncbi:MAG TPA: glycosyltransferase family 2 protein [Cyclobacteriaceae bacterium]
MMDVSIVILNFNGESLLRQFLPSVMKHSGEATIYVADNGSTDQSVALLEHEFPTVRTIKFSTNYGFCKGYNEALNRVRSDLYILLNSDVEVTGGWLSPIIRLFEANADIDAVQPKIRSSREPGKFEYAGAGGGFIDSLGYPFCRGRIFNRIESDHGQYDDECEVFWASGACMAIKADAFLRLGGFDEDFFAHMEEIDLCWKIQRSGKKVFYTGRSIVYHLGAGTLTYNHPRKTYLNFRNNLSMLIKHLNSGELIVKIPVRLVLDWLAAFIFVLKGDPSNALAVLKAHGAVLSLLGNNLHKRKALRRKYPRYPKRNIYPGLILLKYYFKRNRSNA